MGEASQKLELCESIIGRNFNDRILGITALQAYPGMQLIDQVLIEIPNNNRIAVLGDKVLSLKLCQMWFKKKSLNRGAWSGIEQATVKNTNLARVGFQHGIDHCVLLGGGTASVGERTMATTIEAIIGAVFEDGDDAAVEALLQRLGLLDHELLNWGVQTPPHWGTHGTIISADFIHIKKIPWLDIIYFCIEYWFNDLRYCPDIDEVCPDDRTTCTLMRRRSDSPANGDLKAFFMLLCFIMTTCEAISAQ